MKTWVTGIKGMRHFTILDVIRFYFTKPQASWDWEEGLVVVFKKYKGVIYVIAQEPIEYGDARNRQLDRFGL